MPTGNSQRISDKKRGERWVLDHFSRLFRPFPDVEPIEGEEPDFTLSSDGRTLGIELTELHRVVPPGQIADQSQEALRHRIVKRAQELYDQRKLPSLHVSVHFAGIPLSKSSVARLAASIAVIVERNIPPPAEARWEEFGVSDSVHFPEELHRVSTYNLPNATRSFFSSPGATWVASLEESDICRAVQSKDAKYERYRRRSDEVWLLISCNGMFMSTWFEGTEAAKRFEIRTNFDRVFLLSHFEDRLFEIQRENPEGPSVSAA